MNFEEIDGIRDNLIRQKGQPINNAFRIGYSRERCL